LLKDYESNLKTYNNLGSPLSSKLDYIIAIYNLEVLLCGRRGGQGVRSVRELCY